MSCCNVFSSDHAQKDRYIVRTRTDNGITDANRARRLFRPLLSSVERPKANLISESHTACVHSKGRMCSVGITVALVLIVKSRLLFDTCSVDGIDTEKAPMFLTCGSVLSVVFLPDTQQILNAILSSS